MCFYIKKNQHPFVESLIRSIVLFKYNFPVTFMRNSLKKHSSDRNLLIPWNSPLLIARQPRNGDDKTGDRWDSHQNCWSKIKQTLTQKTDCPVLSPSILVTIIRVCVCVYCQEVCERHHRRKVCWALRSWRILPIGAEDSLWITAPDPGASSWGRLVF